MTPTLQRSRNDLVQTGEQVLLLAECGVLSQPASALGPCERRAWAPGPSTCALMSCSPAQIETEKDQLLERFMQFARHVCEEIDQEGGFADYIDPCSGLPVRPGHTCECRSA